MSADQHPSRMTAQQAAGEAHGNVVALITLLEERESVLTVLRGMGVRELQNTLETMAGYLHAALYEVHDLRGDEPDPQLGLIGAWLRECGLEAARMRVGLPPTTPEAAQ